MDVDVAVAGVGVAGTFTLNSLSKDLKVVGIDKKEKLGYPVECGEIVPTREEMEQLLPDLHDHSLFDVPKRFETNTTRETDFVLPNGKTFQVDFNMHVLNRDKMLQSIASNSGHELKLNTKITDFRDGELVLDNGEIINPKVTVACDGANSRIAKKLGVWNYARVPAKQYLVKGVECEEDVIYMFVGKQICPGAYAWIIPKGKGYANVGLGFIREQANQGDNIHKALGRFVSEYPYSSKFLKDAEIVSKIGAFVPVDPPLQRTVYGNTMLVGDSASMVLSHVGAGIPTSMVAGDQAGKAINQYFDGGRLDKFDAMWKVYLLEAMERSNYIKRSWDMMGNEEISRYMKLVTNRDMAEILRSKVPLKLRLFSALFPLLKRII